jgi:peptidoglycan hydrolase CwlO-like protein
MTNEVIALIISVGLILLTQYIIASRSSKDKLEAANNLAIVKTIEVFDAKISGKLDKMTETQYKMEKKMEDMDREMRERKEEATKKAHTIQDLEKNINHNHRDIEEIKKAMTELRDQFKQFTLQYQMREIKETVIPNEKYTK